MGKPPGSATAQNKSDPVPEIFHYSINLPEPLLLHYKTGLKLIIIFSTAFHGIRRLFLKLIAHATPNQNIMQI
jgi:hypothetical protein